MSDWLDQKALAKNLSVKPRQIREQGRKRIPVRDRITCSVRDAMEATGIGKTKLFELITDGRIETVKIDGRRLVQVASLLELLKPTHISTHKKIAVSGKPQRTTTN